MQGLTIEPPRPMRTIPATDGTMKSTVSPACGADDAGPEALEVAHDEIAQGDHDEGEP